MEGTNIVLHLLKSLLFKCYRPRNRDSLAPKVEATEAALPREGEALTRGDFRAVRERIGMIGWSDDNEEDSSEDGARLMEGVDELLEEKEASTEELKEAFYVFDRDEDGFISAAELWSVMRRLGLEEGMRMEDCERMICSFDEDGDGRISFHEFKKLLENAL